MTSMTTFVEAVRRHPRRAMIAGAGLALATITLLKLQLLWLFVMIFADGIVPLVPGEAALLSQAPAAFAGGLSSVLVLAGVAATAAFLGDTTTYLLGRWVGTDRFAWQRRPRVTGLLARTGTELERRGLPLILSARLLPGWRVAITFMAGATHLGWPRFVVASLLGALLWAAYLLGIGTTIGAITGGGPVVVAILSLATTAGLAHVVRRLRRGRQSRSVLKKSRSSSVASSANTPVTTSGRWFSRLSRTTSHKDPTAPALSSYAPKTRRSTRESTTAPAHMVHGSRVTTSVQPESRHSPVTSAAARKATTSAWPVGSPSASRTLWPRAMTSPSGPSTTAPIGTSPVVSAARASSRAARIAASYFMRW